MAHELKRLSFHEFVRHLTGVFDAMARQGEPVLIERDGQLYRLEPEETHQTQDIWAGYDPEKVREVLDKVAGGWADLDIEGLIANIYRAREQGSRPASRP
ncbi:MAG: hypothetical protein HY690_10195 [Chloroflexi bacterium]|nr:hypothetical protein [Chloroflexota bacterium]